MNAFLLQRLGVLMEPEPGNPLEIGGVCNPAAARGPDGRLYLFPRLVAKGNYSRIGIARVVFDALGQPRGVERLGIALEPTADYERRSDGSGGCEDARVTFVEPLGHYVMTYTALSQRGPRIALAMSKDLLAWVRIGLAKFEPYEGIDFADVDNKDASIFPVALPNHAGKLQLALLHRPLFPGTRPAEIACQDPCRKVDRGHESIWISYCPMPAPTMSPHLPGLFNSHRRLATPVSAWEKLKIGGGTPPIMTRHGWLILYHGVRNLAPAYSGECKLSYSAGVMVMSAHHPQDILYRSAQPVLKPELPQERRGMIADVVFPTGIDRREDLGSSDRYDIYYGMADTRIGVARLDVPAVLPAGATADAPDTGFSG
jgi:predicted GH43/DUF377 family glycosyl hydrolase